MKGCVSIEIVTRIAAREGVDPLELEPILNDVVDADALDALMQETDGRPDQANVRVIFAYCGYLVTVAGSDGVTLEKRGVRSDESSGNSGTAY